MYADLNPLTAQRKGDILVRCIPMSSVKPATAPDVSFLATTTPDAAISAGMVSRETRYNPVLYIRTWLRL
jgi:hypothetical protein